MRQRRVKDLDQRLVQVSEYIIDNPEQHRGQWQSVFERKGDLYLEIGCGKGQFLLQHASANPQSNYIGIEGQRSVVLRGLEAAKAQELQNIRFAPVFVRNLCDFFQDGELAGIFLNFSDPWPKARHAKRRLTHVSFLEKYRRVVKPGGSIEIKTDNDDLYYFTVEQAKLAGMQILAQTMDLHNSAYSAKEITTEYEDKFCRLGERINYIKF